VGKGARGVTGTDSQKKNSGKKKKTTKRERLVHARIEPKCGAKKKKKGTTDNKKESLSRK
jgi:hypothetical protein